MGERKQAGGCLPDFVFVKIREIRVSHSNPCPSVVNQSFLCRGWKHYGCTKLPTLLSRNTGSPALRRPAGPHFKIPPPNPIVYPGPPASVGRARFSCPRRAKYTCDARCGHWDQDRYARDRCDTPQVVSPDAPLSTAGLRHPRVNSSPGDSRFIVAVHQSAQESEDAVADRGGEILHVPRDVRRGFLRARRTGFPGR